MKNVVALIAFFIISCEPIEQGIEGAQGTCVGANTTICQPYNDELLNDSDNLDDYLIGDE